MASAKRILAFLLMLAFSGVLLGAVYKVGDSASWSMKRNIDFFFPFFNLRFRASGSATFSQVSFNDFQSCGGTSAIASDTSGSDSIPLPSTGPATTSSFAEFLATASRPES
ncbi:hypothetical protein SCA6_014562 [Theobroma cacao]